MRWLGKATNLTEFIDQRVQLSRLFDEMYAIEVVAPECFLGDPRRRTREGEQGENGLTVWVRDRNASDSVARRSEGWPEQRDRWKSYRTGNQHRAVARGGSCVYPTWR